LIKKGGSAAEKKKKRGRISALHSRINQREREIELQHIVNKKEEDYQKMLQICKKILKGKHLTNLKEQLMHRQSEGLKYIQSESDSNGPNKEQPTKI
jgi:hypothetical protein